jgi:hypothetical protein
MSENLPSKETFFLPSKIEQCFDEYRVEVNNRTPYTVAGKVFRPLWGTTDENVGWEECVDFYIKWDGCMEISCDTHLCGAYGLEMHISLLKQLYDWARQYIPMNEKIAAC